MYSGRVRASIRFTAVAGVAACVFAICFSALSSTATAGTQTFGYVSNSPQTFNVPDGITQLSVVVRGARGGVVSTGYDPSEFGPDTTHSGIAGSAQGLLPVVPGQTFDVYVGQYGFGSGGWGWASGGAGGTGSYKVNKKLVNNPGAGGGGASAILTGANPQQIVAVGGGGGGNGGEFSPILDQPPGSSPDGYPNLPGGNGGDAGQSGDPGWALESSSPGGTGPNDHGKVGGCGGCQSVPQGYEGTSLGYGHDGSGGGGGGGGYKGGGGGDDGYRSFDQFGMGGGGGGGGSSFIASSAIDPSVGIAASSPCSMTAGGGTFDPYCHGSVTFTWPGSPQVVTIQGATSANAPIGGQYGDFKVQVADKDGIPVPNTNVTFSGPANGASAVFAGGGSSTSVVTDPQGFATISGFRANGAAGNWNLTATASGGSSPSARFSMTNFFDSSTTVLGVNPDPSFQGQPVEIYADVAAGSSTVLPTGVVLFLIDDLPAGEPVAIGPGNRATLPMAQVASLGVGIHTIKAVYPGDSGHAGSQDSESQTVKPSPTSITVDSSTNPSGAGENVELTATVTKASGSTGTPTGTVEFRDDDLNLLGTAPVDGTGKAQFSFEPDETVTVTATYDGDTVSGQSSGRYVQSVGPEATSTVITGSGAPAVYGQTLTFIAQVRRSDQGAAVEGTIGIEIDGEIVCPDTDVDVQGQVTCVPAVPLDAGVHEVDAKYNPPNDSADDQPDQPSTGSFNQVVHEAPSQTDVSISPEPSVFGQPTTLAVRVSLPDNPGLTAPGTASILIDGIGAGDLTLTGGGASRTDTCAVPGNCPYSAGSHIVEADYSSTDPNLLSTDASVHHEVTPAATVTTIESSADPVEAGSPVTFEANVASSAGAGTPDGRVAFSARGAAVGNPVPLIDGKASSAPIASLSEGTHKITARYLGSTNFGPSGANLSERVTAASIPDRGHPYLRFKGTRIKVGRGGSLKVEMICGGDRGMICRGLATVRNRKAVKIARRGRKAARLGPGKLLARKVLTIPAGDTAFRTFKLNRRGKKVFRATRKATSVIRLAAKSGTDPSKPHDLKILSKVKRPEGGPR